MTELRVAAMLLALAALAVLTGLPGAHSADIAVTRWLQRPAPAPDVPAMLLVFLGDAEVVIPAAVLAGVLLLRRDRRRARLAFWLAAGLLAATALAFTLKHLIPHLGPPAALQRHILRMGVGVPQPFSFPSGHTTRAVFLGGTLLRRSPAWAALLVAAMMAALVYLGDHWTSDVLGGLCLGGACVAIAQSFLDRVLRD